MKVPTLRRISLSRRLVWLAGAVLLWGQLGALAHHHDEGGAPHNHRATDCALCVALAAPVAAPPAAVALPQRPAATRIRLASAQPFEIPAQRRQTAHGPRAPPLL